ncbi:AI-2E family transporter [Brenneria corticis]|uniref:Pheromone autoinducer 2 transporter n=1 Tax=Brenneria corticis TaxID=2173106 RepID=A0A2U1TR66_9GAMM|nr:AI-2E family transporter [Brenneria sp. CFCC 11842]PWC11888.1 pheromone autoinducer 2 transporter [Brenneria sp. CFCC 11842]
MRTPLRTDNKLLQRMLLLAALTVVVIGAHMAASILSLLLLSLFLVIVLEPVVGVICRTGLPRPLVVTLLGLILLLALTYTLLMMVAALPEFNQMSMQMQWLLTRQLADSKLSLESMGLSVTPEAVVSLIDPGQFLSLIARMLNRISNLFSAALVVFLTVVFMLIEVPSLATKTQKLFRAASPEMQAVRSGIASVTHYLVLKTLISAANGLAVWGVLSLLQVKFAFIWGIIAFLFNFIPLIGSIVASLPPLIQAFVFNGFATGAAALVIILLINLLLGCVLEPYLFGRKLNMSVSVIMISLLVWGGILGMIGVLLAVPLTMTCKLTLEQINGGKRWARLMEG